MYSCRLIRTCATCIGPQTNWRAPIMHAISVDKASSRSPNLIIFGQRRNLEFTVSARHNKVARSGFCPPPIFRVVVKKPLE